MRSAIKKLSGGVFDAFGGSQTISADVILEAIPSPLLVLDKEDGVSRVNQAAEQFFRSSASVLDKASLQD